MGDKVKLHYEGKFDAAHKLYDSLKSPQENFLAFGKCTNLHGHTWRVAFEVEGFVFQNGMLVNFTELKELLNTFDHSYINEKADFLPTAENLADYFMTKLLDKEIFTSISVKVWESDHAYAEAKWTAS